MIKKKEFLWNAAGSIIFSIFSAVILMACTRLNGVEIAGIFAICHATTSILNSIGDLGIRIIQVTDVKRKYTYGDYLFSRLLAIFSMIVIAAVFVVIAGYSHEKLFIFIVLILMKVLDNLSETFQAEFQLNERLDLAGKSLLIRNLLEIITFILLNKFVKNVYVSFIGMFLMGLLILGFYEIRNVLKYQKFKTSFDFSNIKIILRESIPLGLSTLVSTYVINAVKYAIDKYNNNKIQTYFNILYMPTFVLNMISLLMIKPFLKMFGEYWDKKEYSKFAKVIIMLNLTLALCTALGEIICLFIGIPVLNWLYKVDLSGYKTNLLLMILSGLFYAMATIMFYALGAIRKQRVTTIIYCLASGFAFVISNILVKDDLIKGATFANLAIMIFLFVGLTSAFVFSFIKFKKSDKAKTIEQES